MPTRAENLRLFVAIQLPDAWTAAFADLIQRMRDSLAKDPRTAGARVRWVRPEGIHLTLKFLGDVEPQRLSGIQDALSNTVAAPPAFGLRAGHLGSFGDRRGPSVIWIGVEGAIQRLIEIATRVDVAMAGLGLAREKRPLAPHLTLARLPDDIPLKARQDIVAIAEGVDLPELAPFNVYHVSLMRSHLGPGGARYERLASFPAE